MTGGFAKRLVGEMVEVAADLISDGHDRLAAALLWRAADEEAWREAPMAASGNDRWAGRFPLGRIGRHLFTVLAWKDRFGNFAEELEKKHAAGLPIELELEEGRLLVEESAELAGTPPWRRSSSLSPSSCRTLKPEERRRLLLAPTTAELMAAARIRPHAHRHPIEFPVEAERRAAGFASWYELFPRSQTGDPGAPRHLRRRDRPAAGDPRDGLRRALFPADPSDRPRPTARAATTLCSAEPGDPGSPYAIGSAEGGHDAIHPALGTLEDFRRLRDAAAQRTAWRSRSISPSNARPTIPGCAQHPDWFRLAARRLDPLRREPAEEIRGHRQRRFLRRQRRAGAVACAARRRAVLGWTRACASSASTIRTPSRCRSGNG